MSRLLIMWNGGMLDIFEGLGDIQSGAREMNIGVRTWSPSPTPHCL
jgi:hypothetical protein